MNARIPGRPKGHRAACNCAVCCTARAAMIRHDRIVAERAARIQMAAQAAEMRRLALEREERAASARNNKEAKGPLRWRPFEEALEGLQA